MTNTPPPAPKVFISYSWTDEAHVEWVIDLAERLTNDGVHVVLDQWDLEEGQDLNAFMEKMVKDDDISRVVMVCDALYAAKADGRQGGVGTETQIISAEVYSEVEQKKFIPIVKERVDGKPCLPTYLKTRKYIDFSNDSEEGESYEQLLRNIFERPARRRPVLGTPPSHLFQDEALSLNSAQKMRRFREVLASGRGSPLLAFEDFAAAFFADLEELRMVYAKEQQETWCDSIAQNIQSALPHRDVLVDTLHAGIVNIEGDIFLPYLLRFLEGLLPFQEPPPDAKSRFEVSEDNYKFLCYEFFLAAFGMLLKLRKFSMAKELLDYQYVASTKHQGKELESHSYLSFNRHTKSIEDFCRKKRNRLSLAADFIHSRPPHRLLSFRDVVQADVILCLAKPTGRWYPRTIVYGENLGPLELFLRALSDGGLEPLQTVLNVSSYQDLAELLEREEISAIARSADLWQGLEEMCCVKDLRYLSEPRER